MYSVFLPPHPFSPKSHLGDVPGSGDKSLELSIADFLLLQPERTDGDRARRTLSVLREVLVVRAHGERATGDVQEGVGGRLTVAAAGTAAAEIGLLCGSGGVEAEEGKQADGSHGDG